ncbi:Protein SET DOMAIN GROUP 41 [Camellia lanceoleosa]|uniref:Protein SET DOMAIN GROUP 41 n=1 Tax=Camellia lanceoleosa TaxID=1840588 RepID=A0ACC0HUV1_9ERIC|nr:Protein SET DOMAIN GROUP 41 [Camellia lanceoleosa]
MATFWRGLGMAKAMAIARRMGDGLALECSGLGECVLEEESAVNYLDLLQPKAMRQSELWFKYHFICSCRQCNAWPPTYVDHTLQEISAVNCNCANLSSDHDFYRYEAIKRWKRTRFHALPLLYAHRLSSGRINRRLATDAENESLLADDLVKRASTDCIAILFHLDLDLATPLCFPKLNHD